MKKNIFFGSIAVAIISLLFISCSFKQFKSRREDAVNARENLSECFVEFRDGTIKKYTTLEFKISMRAFQSPKKNPQYLLADGKEKIEPVDVVKYQTKNYYAILARELNTFPKLTKTTEALLGFAIRMEKGKINLYYMGYTENGLFAEKDRNNEGKSVQFYGYYLQKNNGGSFVSYTDKLLREYVKDNPAVYAKASKKIFKTQDFINLVKMYNQQIN